MEGWKKDPVVQHDLLKSAWEPLAIWGWMSNLKVIFGRAVILGGQTHFSSTLWKLAFLSVAYWNATRAFMILSAMSCFAGIIAGILSFAHFSAFERFNRSFAAGIMFFVSSEWWLRLFEASLDVSSGETVTDSNLCCPLSLVCQPFLFCLRWPFTPGSPWTSWASASVTGASRGPTY